MPRFMFKRLTYAEATAMTRSELLVRVEREQQYWHRQLDQGRIGYDDEGWRKFRRIMHLIDPHLAVSDALRAVKGEPGPSYWDSRPQDDDTDREF